MSLSHYPKIVHNVVLAWVQPSPPRRPGFLGKLGFAEINRFAAPIAPGQTITGYHDAQPFTRFYGSFASDQPLLVQLAFSNDEVDVDGLPITDATLPSLHYDAIALRREYDPKQQAQSGKFFETIYGRWLRVEITNAGDEPTRELRVFVRGSVF